MDEILPSMKPAGSERKGMIVEYITPPIGMVSSKFSVLDAGLKRDRIVRACAEAFFGGCRGPQQSDRDRGGAFPVRG